MKKINILCTICARGGSKGLINKNIKKINNIPLISYTINQAINSKIFQNIVLSSDNNKILNIAESHGLDIFFKRPKHMSNDNYPKIPVIIHALKKAEKKYKKNFDIIIDLDPTSPIRDKNDIKKALNKFIKFKANNLISVTKSRKNPYFNMVEMVNNKVQIVKMKKKSYYTRQASPLVYDMNASIYIWNKNYLITKGKLINNKTIIYEMPKQCSFDIDNEIDFEINKLIIKNEKIFR